MQEIDYRKLWFEFRRSIREGVKTSHGKNEIVQLMQKYEEEATETNKVYNVYNLDNGADKQ